MESEINWEGYEIEKIRMSDSSRPRWAIKLRNGKYYGERHEEGMQCFPGWSKKCDAQEFVEREILNERKKKCGAKTIRVAATILETARQEKQRNVRIVDAYFNQLRGQVNTAYPADKLPLSILSRNASIGSTSKTTNEDTIL